MAISRDKLLRLNEIMNELESLSRETREIFREGAPEELAFIDAYGVLDFGTSSNPHDRPLQHLITAEWHEIGEPENAPH